MQQRLTKLRRILKNRDLDAFLITAPPNVYYISGLKADAASLLISQDDNFIITDFRYKEEAEAVGNFKVRLIEGGFKNTLKKILHGLKTKRLGFEGAHLSYSAANDIMAFLKKCGVGFESLRETIEWLRLYKDATEVREIKRAIGIARDAIAWIRNELRPGITEKKLSIMLDNFIRARGAEANAFETIVASGRNSSRPHSLVTNRILKKNEHILIDFGVRANGYNCDLTRVFFLGRIQRQLRDIYKICIEAQARAIKRVRPGVTARAVDSAARDYIASRGYAKYFGHSLGHGVGLAVHELPDIAPKNNRPLRPGMVFTVEPGIYLEGLGGIRIEDMVSVTEKGCEVLTNDIPK